MTTFQAAPHHDCPCTPALSHCPRWWTVLAGQLLAAAIYGVAVPLGGVDLVARTGDTTLTIDLSLVMGVSLLAGVAAVAWMGVLRRFTDRPDRNWTISAAAVLLVSLAGPAGATGVAAGLTLASMHIGVAAGLAAGSLRLDSARLS